MKSIITKRNAPYFFLAPMIILFLAFMAYPIADSFRLSFFNFEGGTYTLVGLNNYAVMLKDPIFWKSLSNTVIYLIVQVPVMVILSLILGVLVEQDFLKFRACYRIGVFLPSITALVAYAMVFKLLLNTDYGIINYVLRAAAL